MRSDAYEKAGISYADMDPFKLAAQRAAAQTIHPARLRQRFGIETAEWSRGESAFLFQLTPLARLLQLVGLTNTMQALVIEGLGTKSLVADDMERELGKDFYDRIAQCTLAMVVNDLITVGALPTIAAMHLAAGDSAWFKNEPRWQALINGWRHACELAGCVWGPG